MLCTRQRAEQHARPWVAMRQRHSTPLTPAATQQIPDTSVVLADGEPSVNQAGHRNHRQSIMGTAAKGPTPTPGPTQAPIPIPDIFASTTDSASVESQSPLSRGGFLVSWFFVGSDQPRSGIANTA